MNPCHKAPEKANTHHPPSSVSWSLSATHHAWTHHFLSRDLHFLSWKMKETHVSGMLWCPTLSGEMASCWPGDSTENSATHKCMPELQGKSYGVRGLNPVSWGGIRGQRGSGSHSRSQSWQEQGPDDTNSLPHLKHLPMPPCSPLTLAVPGTSPALSSWSTLLYDLSFPSPLSTEQMKEL